LAGLPDVLASTGPPLIGDGESITPGTPPEACRASTGPPLIGDGEEVVLMKPDEAAMLQRVRR